MTWIRGFGIFFMLCGGALFGLSQYIADQVAQGEQKISSAQKKVDTGSRLFSLSPVGQDVGKGITDSAQKKIDAGKQQVAEYSQLAHQLQTGGIIVAAIGLVGVLFGGKRKKR
ncbi:MAG: hypothetical protein JSS61_05320 [Verrucomicrobia bacterium]|nr:hypothetical protein [Verrucomicrobiota bacterium]